jgi:catechol 2,3-dioxygenase-like lactoylglutathione lyase family enzyme
MKIKLTSVMVDDQDKALGFYTQVLGFEKRVEIPLGKHRWLTVGSPDSHEEVQLVLEPNDNPAARTYQAALKQQGIPLTAFFVDDVASEYERLKKLGVEFRTKPTQAGPTTIAVFDDTCGNLIQICQG